VHKFLLAYEFLLALEPIDAPVTVGTRVPIGAQVCFGTRVPVGTQVPNGAPVPVGTRVPVGAPVSIGAPVLVAQSEPSGLGVVPTGTTDMSKSLASVGKGFEAKSQSHDGTSPGGPCSSDKRRVSGGSTSSIGSSYILEKEGEGGRSALRLYIPLPIWSLSSDFEEGDVPKGTPAISGHPMVAQQQKDALLNGPQPRECRSPVPL
jgi:hypothetical protein